MKKSIQFKIYFVTSPVAIKSVIVHIFRSYIHEYMPGIGLIGKTVLIIIGQFFTTKKRLIQKTSNRKPTRAPTFYDVKHINVVA